MLIIIPASRGLVCHRKSYSHKAHTLGLLRSEHGTCRLPRQAAKLCRRLLRGRPPHRCCFDGALVGEDAVGAVGGVDPDPGSCNPLCSSLV